MYKNKEIKVIVFDLWLCKTKYNKITRNKNSLALEIHISWLSYGDIKIGDAFVYKQQLS